MAKKKSKGRIKKRVPPKLATGVWYLMTSISTVSFSALLLSIFLADGDIPNWRYYAVIGAGILNLWLIYTRNFTTSETIAWRRRTRR